MLQVRSYKRKKPLKRFLPKKRVRFRVINITSLTAVILFLFLCTIAIVVIISGGVQKEQAAIGTVAPVLTPAPSIKTEVPEPTFRPVYEPTVEPASTPTPVPTSTPTPVPTSTPTPVPTATPTPVPTTKPVPTMSPTAVPASVSAPTATPVPLPVTASSISENTASKVLVVVDPGHGGIDPGAVSVYKQGFYEKEITLDIGLKLRKLLEKSGITVLMTRETDTEVYKSARYNNEEDVRERPRIANRNNATFFVSIHVNSFDVTKKAGDTYNGTEIYHPGKKHGAFTSKQFAEIMGQEIKKKTDTKYNGVIERGLGVLRLSDMPALLVETAYLSNKEDHKRLETEKFRNEMAEGIHNGIIEILKTMGAYEQDGEWYIVK